MLGGGEVHGRGVFAGAGGGRGIDDDYVFGGWEEGSLEGRDGDWVRGDDDVGLKMLPALYKHIRLYG